MTHVDDAQRVVGAEEGRVLAQGEHRPRVGVVEPARGERFGGPVARVHRQHRRFADLVRLHPLDVFGRQEVDGQGAQVAGRLRVHHAAADSHVDVPRREQQVAGAAPGLVEVGALVDHRQAQLMRERRGHDDQRQAVAGARVERLRRRLGARGVVLELELRLLVKRLDQAHLRALEAQLVGDVDGEVAFHRVADGEHVVGADRLARRAERPRGEQRRRCFGDRRRACAGGQEAGSEPGQQADCAHRFLHVAGARRRT